MKKIVSIASQNWLEEILAREHDCHWVFFRQRFFLSSFRRTLEKHGPKKITEWRKLDLEPHFLPKVVLTPEAEIPGWKIRPNNWFWEQVAAGRVLEQQDDGNLAVVRQVCLPDKTILIDIRLKPACNNGKQMFKNDNLLGPIIKQLRKEGKIAKYDDGPQSSRFGVSADEWENHIKPELAKLLGLKVLQVRLGKAIEENIISQLYPHMPRCKDGKTDTLVLYEEFLDRRGLRLSGGDSDEGGLVHVTFDSSGFPGRCLGFRPLAVL